MAWPRRGAQRHNPAGQRGYHTILAIAAGTGDVLMARLRKGRANTARGAAHFLRETVSRVRYAGATGPLTLRADSGFYSHAIVASCRDKGVRYSITVRQHQSLHNIIKAIPEAVWTPTPTGWRAPPTWPRQLIPHSSMSPTPQPCGSSSGGSSPPPAPNWPCSPPTAIMPSSPTVRATPWTWRPITVATPLIENAIRDLKYGVGLNHLPSGRFPANAAWLAVQVMAYNLARWTTRIGLGEPAATAKTLRRRFFSLAGRLTRKAYCLTLHLPQGWPRQKQFNSDLAKLRSLPLPS